MKGVQFSKKEIKPSLFADNTIIHIESPKESTKNPGTNQRALQGYIIQVKRTHTHIFFTVFLHSNEHMGIEIKNIIPFMSVQKWNLCKHEQKLHG